MDQYIREACVESLEQVLKAQQKGADRIELCDRLDLGGTTPSKELILAANETGLPVRVMIRPRGGNFSYSTEELEEMVESIKFCKTAGVEAVVLGVVKEDGKLDYEEIARLVKIAKPLKVVVHKAIDETPDPVQAVGPLLAIDGVSSILTSGGSATAFEGKKRLKEMLETVGGKLEIVVAGKVTAENLDVLHECLNATAYHGKLIVGEL